MSKPSETTPAACLIARVLDIGGDSVDVLILARALKVAIEALEPCSDAETLVRALAEIERICGGES